jgi:hypothetical protein
MNAFADIGYYRDAVECYTGDVQLERKPDETGHGVIEKYFSGQRYFDITSIFGVAEDLEILRPALSHARWEAEGTRGMSWIVGKMLIWVMGSIPTILF